MLVHIVHIVRLREFLRVRTYLASHHILYNKIIANTNHDKFSLSRVYETYYLKTFLSDHSPSDVAWIGAIQSFAQFSAALVAGPLADRYGAMVRWARGSPSLDHY
jgi:MFS family permease